jgi:hypothetical protein
LICLRLVFKYLLSSNSITKWFFLKSSYFTPEQNITLGWSYC